MNLSLRNPWLHMLGLRGLQVVALALIIGTLCFFMVRALPGDLAMRVAAIRYGLDLVSGAAADTVRAELGLDQSAWQGLLGGWRDMATFNLGQSLITQRPVWVDVGHHLGATLRLSAAALAVALAVGLPLGAVGRAAPRPLGRPRQLGAGRGAARHAAVFAVGAADAAGGGAVGRVARGG